MSVTQKLSPSKRSDLDGQRPLITVVVATYNRADMLSLALESLIDQTTGGLFDYEVVVVDNASTDRTPPTVEYLASVAAIPVRRVIEPRPGIPFARNAGFRNARGDWIAFFDDDQCAEPDWLRTLYQAAVTHDALCVGGARTLTLQVVDVEVRDRYCRELLGEIVTGRPYRYSLTDLPCTGNVLIQRDLIGRLGAFDETILDGGEDSDFFNRLIASGAKAVYEPRAVVQHLIPAVRLRESYLKWIASRHGRHVARRDLRRVGWPLALSSAVLRVLQAVTYFWPLYFLAVATRRRWTAVGLACRIYRMRGYIRFILFGGSASQTIASTHRGRG